MSGVMAAIVAGLTNACFAVLAKLFTQTFFEAVISRVTVALLRMLAKHTTNTVDDDIANEVAERLGLGMEKEKKEPDG